MESLKSMKMCGFIKNNVDVMIASPSGLAINDYGKRKEKSKVQENIL